MKKTLLASAAALALVAGSALAAPNFYVQANTGWVGAVSDTGSATINGSQLDKVSQNHLGAGVSVGAMFNLTKSFSVGPQLGYEYYGSSQLKVLDDSFRARTTSNVVNLLAVAQYNISNFNLLAGAGVAYQMNHFALSGTFPANAGFNHPSDNKANFAAEAMVGASYNLTKQIAVGLQYRHVFGAKQYTLKDGVLQAARERFGLNAILATVRYTFA